MGKFTDFKLMLKSLPQGKHEFEYHLDKQFFANMENPDVRDADVKVTLEVDHRAESYDFTFRLDGTLTLLCDRCLDELQIEISPEYRLTVKYGDDYNDESDSLLVLPESENSLNVAYMIYDTAVLAIPPRHVHPQGKCNRAMSALNKKYTRNADEDADEEEGIATPPELDDMDMTGED